MIVRCGACRNQFDVPGEGRFSCPVCGSVNMVRSRPGSPGPAGTPPPGTMPPTGGPGLDGMATPPAPPPPPPPEVKTQCTSCGFSFIVGEISLATCPMCGAEVQTGLAESDPAPPAADHADHAQGVDTADAADDDGADDSTEG